MVATVRFVKNLLLTILLLMIGIYVVIKGVGFVVEPLYSKRIMIPTAERIAYKLQGEMPVPPTHQYLKEFTEGLVKEGEIVNPRDITIQYVQSAGSSNYMVFINYSKILPLTYQVHGDVRYDGHTQYYEEDLSVSNLSFVESKELSAQARAAAGYGVPIIGEGSSAGSEAVNQPEDVVNTELPGAFDEYLVYHLREGKMPVGDFGTRHDANVYAQAQGFVDYEVLELMEDRWDSEYYDIPEYRVYIEDIERASFYQKPDAIAYAMPFHRAEVYVPNTVIWSNIPVILYADEELVGEYASKADAIHDAMWMEYAKLVDQDTEHVVWDNYPRECGTCDSAIQDQY